MSRFYAKNEPIFNFFLYFCDMNKLRFHILSLFLLWIVHDQVFAQSQWRHIDGLPCEETTTVVQDSDGYIWIGSRLGLFRYDGYQIKLYRNDMSHPHAFSSCDIKAISCDNDGHIYAGSFFGLNILSKRTNRIDALHFTPSDYINSVFYCADGKLWVGTGNGLYVVDRNHQIMLVESVPYDNVLSICDFADSGVVVVTGHYGVFHINRNGKCTVIEGTESLKPRCVYTDRESTLWIGTDRNGLYQYTASRQLVKRADFPNSVINDIIMNPSRQGLLLATDRGIVSYSEGTTQIALMDKNILSLYKDRDDNVWAATEGQGVFFMPNQGYPFSVEERLFTHQTMPILSQFHVGQLADTVLWKNISSINAVFQDERDATYIGTWNDGLYVIENGRENRHITTENSTWLKDNSIYSISDIGEGDVLISTWNGIYILSKHGEGTFVGRLGNTDISSIHALTVFAKSPDDFWLGLVGGIIHIKGNLHHPETASIKLYTHVNQSAVDNPPNVAELADRHDETGDYQLGGIFRIVEDKNGRIWACTSEPGLLLFEAEHDLFTSVSQQMGILGDNVHSLDIDNFGNFWMTTNYGILQMKLDDNCQPVGYKLYTMVDGLPTNYFGSTMSTVLEDGTLCFVNHDHMITTTPKDLLEHHYRQKVFVSDIQVNGLSLSSNTTDSLSLLPNTDHIVLAHNQNNITLRLSTLSYGQESSIRYAYCLHGFDNDYRQTDMGVNSISYNQLPPGTYRLSYRVQMNGVIQEENEQYMVIEILQPLWWRWWARVIYVLILVGIAYIVFHNIRDRRSKKRQLKLLEMEKMKQQEVYQKKMQLYSKMLHEFLTPLKLMNEMLHDLHKKVRPSLQATLFMLTNQADRLEEAMTTIVDVKEDTLAQETMQKAENLSLVDRDFLRRCTESVNKHLSDAEYSHIVMMEEVGASHATLYRKLKALTGMDATSFIRTVRMRTACQILENERDIRINELAERVGYSNPKYFSVCFKKEFGVSPKDYVAEG